MPRSLRYARIGLDTVGSPWRLSMPCWFSSGTVSRHWYQRDIACAVWREDKGTIGRFHSMTDYSLVTVIPVRYLRAAQKTLYLQDMSGVVKSRFRETCRIDRGVRRPSAKCPESFLLDVHPRRIIVACIDKLAANWLVDKSSEWYCCEF